MSSLRDVGMNVEHAETLLLANGVGGLGCMARNVRRTQCKRAHYPRGWGTPTWSGTLTRSEQPPAACAFLSSAPTRLIQ